MCSLLRGHISSFSVTKDDFGNGDRRQMGGWRIVNVVAKELNVPLSGMSVRFDQIRANSSKRQTVSNFTNQQTFHQQHPNQHPNNKFRSGSSHLQKVNSSNPTNIVQNTTGLAQQFYNNTGYVNQFHKPYINQNN